MSSLRREDFVRFAFVAAFGVWLFAAAGLFIAALSEHVVLQAFAVGAGLFFAYIYHRNRGRIGFQVESDNDENLMTGNSGQPRVVVNVGVSKPPMNK